MKRKERSDLHINTDRPHFPAIEHKEPQSALPPIRSPPKRNPTQTVLATKDQVKDEESHQFFSNPRRKIIKLSKNSVIFKEHQKVTQVDIKPPLSPAKTNRQKSSIAATEAAYKTESRYNKDTGRFL